MTFISYAQNFEDVMLHRAFKNVECGTYIDVGAQDPVVESVTCAFYKRGWRGVNVEPMKAYFKKIVEERPKDINLNIGLSSKEEVLTLYEFPDTGLSTSNKAFAKRHQDSGLECQLESMKCKTLDQICQEHKLKDVHFLKIDVEGHEKQVLEGFSFKDVRPRILVIEATEPNVQLSVSHLWEQIVLRNGYKFAYFDGLNRFYVAKEHQELLRHFDCPPNWFDDFILHTTLSFQEKLAAAERGFSDARNEIHTLQERLNEATSQHIEIERELLNSIDTQKDKIRKQQDEIVKISSRNKSLHSVLDGVYKSKSWKMTKILRLANRGWSLLLSELSLKKLLMFVYTKMRQFPRFNRLFVENLNRFPAIKGFVKVSLDQSAKINQTSPICRSPQKTVKISQICKSSKKEVSTHLSSLDLTSNAKKVFLYLTNQQRLLTVKKEC